MAEISNDREVAIRLSGVKKRYVLGQIGGRTLQADIQSWWARKRGKEDPNMKIGQDQRLVGKSFMALNGIDLTIYKGEAVGIIGHNGAGKSTMLKLLSRVTAPTEGEIDLYGRVASMLEVGTGFNGEMTGRENIYMNGAILGMTKAEIDAKMEQIIDFSEVRDFIDTPVKRYSSGMYVKLAFSVAAHLDNEIMIMDEVLAVGDMAFQKKCLDKMREAATKEGRTVLYVSHNMNTIRLLCERCIVLDQGKVMFDGGVEEAISIYLGKNFETGTVNEYTEDRSKAYKLKGLIDIKRTVLEDKEFPLYKMGERIKILIDYNAHKEYRNMAFRVSVFSVKNEIVGMASTKPVINCHIGENQEEVSLSLPLLAPGRYITKLVAFSVNEYGNTENLDVIDQAFSFEITQERANNNVPWQSQYWGNIMFPEIQIEGQ
jgi:lipopolysaccharide transport system ATP-binding protein